MGCVLDLWPSSLEENSAVRAGRVDPVAIDTVQDVPDVCGDGCGKLLILRLSLVQLCEQSLDSVVVKADPGLDGRYALSQLACVDIRAEVGVDRPDVDRALPLVALSHQRVRHDLAESRSSEGGSAPSCLRALLTPQEKRRALRIEASS